MTLEETSVTGSDENHFCQPTDVAVASNGIFFVADGYCNQRIMKFDPSGKLITTYKGAFNVPHSLALFEEHNALCIADRDNARLVCINAGLGDGPNFGTPFGRSSGRKVGQVYAIAGKGTILIIFHLIFRKIIIMFNQETTFTQFSAPFSWVRR